MDGNKIQKVRMKDEDGTIVETSRAHALILCASGKAEPVPATAAKAPKAKAKSKTETASAKAPVETATEE